MKKLLIVGGSGFIGSNLIKEFLTNKKKDFEIFVSTRSKKNLVRTNILSKKDISKLNVIESDLTRESSLNTLSKLNFDYVIYAAGLLGGKSLNKRDYEEVNVKATLNLLKNLNKEGLKLFVYFSSAGVVGPNSKPVCESHPYNPTNLYEKTKAEAEEIVKSYCKREGIKLCVLRPSIVFGPGDIHLLPLFKMAGLRFQFVIEHAKARLSFIYIDDLRKAVVFILENNITGIYFLSNKTPVRLKNFLALISKEVGVKPILFSLPKELAFFIAKINKSLIFFHIKPLLTEERVKFFIEDRCFKTQRLKSKGFDPETSIKEGIHKTIIWYKEKHLL